MMTARSDLRKNVWRIAIAVVVLILLVPITRFVYHTKTETFPLTYFPDNSYRPAAHLPSVDERGEPKIVLVRRSGQIECFDVFYSTRLMELLEAAPSEQVNVTYRVSYRFGRSFWIETLDVAALGIEPTLSRHTVMGAYRTGDVAPGVCF